jgi:hypothetical protein
MSAKERDQLDRDGFVVRTGVFDASERIEITRECETLVDRLLAAKRRTKHAIGSYMFEIQREFDTAVKWEPGAPDIVQGLEPFAHLSEPLRDWGLDSRLIDPCKDVVGSEEVILFTEKLNLKRKKDGGPIILHQDFPYWEPVSTVAARVATAMIFLDDAMRDNGCLEVARGSHRSGVYEQRKDSDGFGSLEMDPAKFDHARLEPLEVKAGAVVFFGAFLVHRSLPNKSSSDRRALLYSYQPPGYPHLRELNNFSARQKVLQ